MHLTTNNKYKNINVIDCKKVAENCERMTTEMVSKLKKAPMLLIATVGHDPASEVYVGNKIETAKRMGIKTMHIKLGEETTTDELRSHIIQWNCNDDIDGIIVQLPVPDHICTSCIRSTIAVDKDVDGLTYENSGRLEDDSQYHISCTPAGIMEILYQNGVKLSGKKVAIFGRSDIVGKPMHKLMMKENAAVTVLHSRIDKDKQMEISRQADVIIVAVGKPWFLQAGFVKDGAVIIDVGINRVEEYHKGVIRKKLVGDVDVENLDKFLTEGYVTSVPGGVGPMTVQMLMRNVTNAVFSKELNNYVL